MKNQSFIESWENCLLNLGVKIKCVNFGSFDWFFPISSFDLEDSKYINGSIYSFKESTESFEGVIPCEDFMVIGVGISGEILIMGVSGDRMYNCYWLGVGFEYHDVQDFNDLLGLCVGNPSGVISDILNSNGRYVAICHDRFD